MPLLLLFLVLAFPPGAPCPGQDLGKPISVCVVPPMADGFVDASASVTASIEDLEAQLRAKGITVIASRKEADIVLEVRGRGKGPAGYASMSTATATAAGDTATGTGFSVPIPVNTYWLAVQLQAGAYRKDLTGTASDWDSGRPWRSCAKAVAKDVAEWINANRGELLRRRSEPEK